MAPSSRTRRRCACLAKGHASCPDHDESWYQTDLLHDVRREVAAISRTLHLALTLIDRTDSPGQYFTSFVASLNDFENVLDVVFYDHTAQIVARSTTLQEHQLPDVNIQQVITTQTPAEGLFRAGRVQR